MCWPVACPRLPRVPLALPRVVPLLVPLVPSATRRCWLFLGGRLGISRRSPALVGSQAEAGPNVGAGRCSLSGSWGLPFLAPGQCSGLVVRFWVLLSNKQCMFRGGLWRVEGLLLLIFFFLIVQDVWSRSSTAWSSNSFLLVVVIPIFLVLVFNIFFGCVPKRSSLAGLSSGRLLGENVPEICPLFILGDYFALG